MRKVAHRDGLQIDPTCYGSARLSLYACDGGYDTRFLPRPGAYPVDWVEPHLEVTALGYPEESQRCLRASHRPRLLTGTS